MTATPTESRSQNRTHNDALDLDGVLPDPDQGAVKAKQDNDTSPTWVPEELLHACTAALHRVDGLHAPNLAITSAIRGEGRSTTAMGMALAQSLRYGRRTILAELDLESPSVAHDLGLKERPGVGEYLRGEAPLAACVQWHGPKLGVLVAGAVGDEPLALQARIPEGPLLTELGLMADTIVADLPPLPPAGAGAYLARHFASLILVVRAGVTPVEQVQRALEGLATRPPVILNGTRTPSPPSRRRRRRG